jgi:hypothetical protein
MAKKRKRKAQSEKSSGKSTSSISSGTTRSLSENFSPDYAYVIRDLRTIGTLAGIFITILVVLAIFLR